MKLKKIDGYLCIDVDELIADEMRDIIAQENDFPIPEDTKYWKKLQKAAKVILGYYTI